MSAQENKENMRRVLEEAFGQGNLARMMPASAGVGREGALTELDVRGSVCPGPTGDTLAALKDLPAGEKLVVISDYLPARQTIPRLVERRGCSWRITEDDGETFRMEIVKGSSLWRKAARGP